MSGDISYSGSYDFDPGANEGSFVTDAEPGVSWGDRVLLVQDGKVVARAYCVDKVREGKKHFRILFGNWHSWQDENIKVYAKNGWEYLAQNE